MMRILHILNDVTDRGNGIVNTAVDLAIEQARQGHRVAVASAGGGYELLLENSGVSHLNLDQARRPAQMCHALFLLRRHILTFHPDIIHAHMRTGLLLAWVWRRIYGFVLVGHVHNVHDRESLLMGLAERVIAVSESVAATMSNRGIAKRSIRVVVNRTLGSPRQPDASHPGGQSLARPSIVTVAGMSHRKGIAELISAFEAAADGFQEAHLYLVGDGPERSLFEVQARNSRWREHIHFEGFQKTPQAYMVNADIFVLASRRESFGLVLIEARQAGCAIIASDVDGTAEALDGGRAGLLVPPQNVPALANALCDLLASDEKRLSWRREAVKGIETFHISRMAREVESVYRELFQEPYRRNAPQTAALE